MWRRWIIRGFFLSLLVLCVAGWAATHAPVVMVEHWGPANHVSLGTGPGFLRFSWTIHSPPPPRWDISTRSVIPGEIDQLDNYGWHYLGFGSGKRPTGWFAEISRTEGFSSIRFIRIPFGFPTIISSLILFYVWQNTARPKVGRAFPIEMATVREKR